MGVAVGDVDTLMSHTLCDSQGGKAHVDQQTDVAMSQIVYADALYPCLLAATVHFPVEIAFADGEHPAVRLHAVELLEVVLQLVTQELGHLDHPVALGRFGVVMTSCLLSRWYDLLMVRVRFSKSKSAGVRASSSPSRTPHQYRTSKA